MDFNNVTTILLSGASISLGAIFGSLRSKIFSSKSRTSLHNYFYGFAGLVLLLSMIFAVAFREEFLKPNWYGIAMLTVALLSSIALIFLTKRYLVIEEQPIVKDTYTTNELNPIVNEWTSNADKQMIKLFGGDLSFFGEGPQQMDSNAQYTHLRGLGFRRICILCEAPKKPITKLRYGKILYDMEETELRFYEPSNADLNVRGRIIRVQNVDKLLVYEKKGSGLYRPIQTDGGDSNGALYNDIWNLIWELAIPITLAERDRLKKTLTESNVL